MSTRTVISRNKRVETPIKNEFTFTQQNVPVLRGSGENFDQHNVYRSRSWGEFSRLPLPTTNDEAWRRTDIRPLRIGRLKLASEIDSRLLPPAPKAILKPLIGKQHGGQILLTAGKTHIDVSPELKEKGVILTDLSTAEQEFPQYLSLIRGKIVRADEGKFSALAASLAQQGVFVYVPKGIRVEEPLHSVLWGPGSELAYLSHILVYVDDGASLTYVHETASPTETAAQSMHAGIVELHVGQEANLRFVELQSWGKHVWNFTHERARVGRNGNLDWIFGAIGSHLTKNFSDLDLAGEGAAGRMSGFYFTDGVQHLDHDTQQNHLCPHTTSDLLFKGALKDTSRSVWQGMIYVAPGAQKTDGYQANRNLVLSSKARADSIPGLEILADDVRCTHGATVGKIDADQVFYLRSRGIPHRDAERLIVEGFFDPIMQRIPFEGIRNRFQDAIREKMR
jgi:Fe-S cluster assembly protein SufD